MLTQRMARSRNIGHSFDWEHPAFLRPHLPDPREVVSAPCTVGGGDVLDGQDTHASDLAALEQLAELFGVPTYEGRLGDIYTLPDSVRRGLVPIQGR